MKPQPYQKGKGGLIEGKPFMCYVNSGEIIVSKGQQQKIFDRIKEISSKPYIERPIIINKQSSFNCYHLAIFIFTFILIASIIIYAKTH